MELEGLIQIIPNKGAYVTGITEKDVKDIYMIRSLLEGLCARWATEHITQEQLAEMEENIYPSFMPRKGIWSSWRIWITGFTISCTRPVTARSWNIN